MQAFNFFLGQGVYRAVSYFQALGLFPSVLQGRDVVNAAGIPCSYWEYRQLYITTPSSLPVPCAFGLDGHFFVTVQFVTVLCWKFSYISHSLLSEKRIQGSNCASLGKGI